MKARVPVAAGAGHIGPMKIAARTPGLHGIRTDATSPGSFDPSRLDDVMEAEARVRDAPQDAVRRGYPSGTARKRRSEAQDMADMSVFRASGAAHMSPVMGRRWTA